MNQEWKRKWIEALRSGHYKQAHRTLIDDKGGFCCLGVLCVIQDQFFDKIVNTDTYIIGEFAQGLPDRVAAILANMNDGYNSDDDDELKLLEPRSFDHIAGYIQAML